MAEKNKYLFIGGPLDGQHLETNDLDFVRVADDNQGKNWQPGDEAISFKEYDYKKHAIYNASRDPIYVYSLDVTGVSVISQLVAGYRKPAT